MARGQLRIEGRDEQAEQIDVALAAFGLQATEPVRQDEEFFLWPECLPILRLWCALATQWQYRPNGKRCGLNYQAVSVCMDFFGTPEADRAEHFFGIQAMERATLEELAA